MRRTCTVPKCLAGETHLFVLLVSLLGCSAVKNNKGGSVFCEAAFQSQRATYGVRREARPWSGGLWSVIRNWRSWLGTPLQPARLDQVYKKHMWALRAPPCMSKERPGTGYCDWFQSQAQALHLGKKKKKKYKASEEAFWLQTQSAVLIFFFFLIYTFMMYKNGQTVTLCSITPSESPQFKLSKPPKNCKMNHRVYMLTYTQYLEDFHKK